MKSNTSNMSEEAVAKNMAEWMELVNSDNAPDENTYVRMPPEMTTVLIDGSAHTLSLAVHAANAKPPVLLLALPGMTNCWYDGIYTYTTQSQTAETITITTGTDSYYVTRDTTNVGTGHVYGDQLVMSSAKYRHALKAYHDSVVTGTMVDESHAVGVPPVSTGRVRLFGESRLSNDNLRILEETVGLPVVLPYEISHTKNGMCFVRVPVGARGRCITGIINPDEPLNPAGGVYISNDGYMYAPPIGACGVLEPTKDVAVHLERYASGTPMYMAYDPTGELLPQLVMPLPGVDGTWTNGVEMFYHTADSDNGIVLSTVSGYELDVDNGSVLSAVSGYELDVDIDRVKTPSFVAMRDGMMYIYSLELMDALEAYHAEPDGDTVITHDDLVHAPDTRVAVERVMASMMTNVDNLAMLSKDSLLYDALDNLVSAEKTYLKSLIDGLGQ